MDNSKPNFHSKNKHNINYNFDELVKINPDLKPFVCFKKNSEVQTIDFFEPKAVKMLNKAILFQYYNLDYWDIPKGFLCPPIPGRADYIHYVAELVDKKSVKCLDIGVGANCIYPIIGVNEYNWDFVGAEFNVDALNSAIKIVDLNTVLKDKIEIRQQLNEENIFIGIIKKEEYFDITICNPPFHSSENEAIKVAKRKIKNLTKKNIKVPILNFGGQNNELFCKGGEIKFIEKMILESKEYSKNCNWFTTLVSKESNLDYFYSLLKKMDVEEYKTINMKHGNKNTRIIAWKY